MALLVCFRNRHQDYSVSGNRHHISPHPSINHRPHTWKKVTSNSFLTQILPKILPVALIFSFTIIWKSSLELNPLIQNSVQQELYLELYPFSLYLQGSIPSLTKRQQNELVLINHSWISPNLQWGWGWGLYFKKK